MNRLKINWLAIDHSDYPMHYKLAMGFADIADGLIRVGSLGFLSPSISMSVSFHYALKWHQKRIEAREDKKNKFKSKRERQTTKNITKV